MMSGVCGRKGKLFVAEEKQEWKMKIAGKGWDEERAENRERYGAADLGNWLAGTEGNEWRGGFWKKEVGEKMDVYKIFYTKLEITIKIVV